MPKKRTHPIVPISFVFLMLAAGLALGQNADKNSAGPTKNDIQLRVVEPLEGATVVGSSVRVTVANSLPRTTQESTGTANMPNPSFRVYLGNTLKGELKRDENVLTIESVPVGSQRLVVEAINPSGEVIDRKEIRFQTVATSAATTSSSTSMTEEKTTTYAPPAPQVASAPEPVTAPATAKAPEPVIGTATAKTPEHHMAAKTLPQTASAAPRAALAGVGLILAGLLLVSRKATA
jgi:hypothetical protein